MLSIVMWYIVTFVVQQWNGIQLNCCGVRIVDQLVLATYCCYCYKADDCDVCSCAAQIKCDVSNMRLVQMWKRLFLLFLLLSRFVSFWLVVVDAKNSSKTKTTRSKLKLSTALSAQYTVNMSLDRLWVAFVKVVLEQTLRVLNSWCNSVHLEL